MTAIRVQFLQATSHNQDEGIHDDNFKIPRVWAVLVRRTSGECLSACVLRRMLSTVRSSISSLTLAGLLA